MAQVQTSLYGRAQLADWSGGPAGLGGGRQTRSDCKTPVSTNEPSLKSNPMNSGQQTPKKGLSPY